MPDLKEYLKAVVEHSYTVLAKVAKHLLKGQGWKNCGW
jgi:hypothetical protein